jgi:hypothetical protein
MAIESGLSKYCQMRELYQPDSTQYLALGGWLNSHLPAHLVTGCWLLVAVEQGITEHVEKREFTGRLALRCGNRPRMPLHALLVSPGPATKVTVICSPRVSSTCPTSSGHLIALLEARKSPHATLVLAEILPFNLRPVQQTSVGKQNRRMN